jgi:acyl-coenzyme A thioesterase PaaI-like protein
MHTDGRLTEAAFQFRPEHVGFRETVHGGLTATILDELMVWACGVATRRLAYCAEMTVRYRRPIPPNAPVVGQAELQENRKGRVLVAKSWIREAGGPLYAEATGKYVPMGSDMSAFAGTDFVDDLGTLFPRQEGDGASG